LHAISLLAVHKRRETKRDDVLLTAQNGGISSDRVISSTYLCTSQRALQIINQGYEW